MRSLATLIAAVAMLSMAPASATAAPTAAAWTQISGTDAGFPRGSNVTSVIEFRGMLWAAGSVYDRSHVSTAASPLRATLWSSRDGQHWSRVVDDSKSPEPIEFGDGRFGMLAATDSALFGFVQFQGSDRPSPAGSDDSLEVWSSSDGMHWDVATETAPGGMSGVLGTDDGLVGVGQAVTSRECRSAACRHGGIWTSPDGAAWSAAEPASEFPAGSYVSAVTRASSGFLAVGWVAKGGALRPLEWRSSNGTEWERVQPLVGIRRQAIQIGALATHRATVLNVGFRQLPDANASTTTTSTSTTTPPTTATTTPSNSGGSSTSTVICVQSANVEHAVWTTTTGQRWRYVRPRGLGDTTTPQRVTYSNGHWLIAGTEGDCSTQRAVVYQSTDGRNWQRAATGPDLAVARDARFPTALAATTKGAILVVSPLSFINADAAPDIWIESPR